MIVSERKMISYIIILLPVIDILNGFALKMFSIRGLGIIVHLFLMVLMIHHIYGSGCTKVDFGIILISFYMLFSNLISNLSYGTSITNGIDYIVKYVYFFVFITCLIKLKMDDISWNKVKQTYIMVYPFGSIIPRLLGINLTSYGDGTGSLGFMYSQNSYTFVMLIVLYWSFEYLFSHFSIKNLFFVILDFVTLMLIGSKSGYIFAAIIVIHFVVSFLKGKRLNSFFKAIAMILMAICLTAFVWFGFNEEILIIYRRVEYFSNYYGRDSLTAILNFLTSDRWNRIAEYWPYLSNNVFSCFLGLGYGFFKNHVTLEMDFLNLIYIFGFIGFGLYMTILLNISKLLKIRNTYKFLIIICFIYLFFGGHVFADVMASGILGIVIVSGQYTARSRKNQYYKVGD